jgi:hypothetical protein
MHKWCVVFHKIERLSLFCEFFIKYLVITRIAKYIELFELYK